MENVIRQSKNKTHILGRLVSYTDVRTGNGKTGVPYVAGTIVVRTTTNEQDNDHKIKFFCQQLTSKGLENKAYTGFMKALQEQKTIEKNGEGDLVQVNCTLRENAYVSNGELRIFNELSANFAPSRVTKEDTEHCAIIELEGIVKNIDKELVNDRPTGRMVLDIISIGYGGSVVELRGYIPEEMAQEFKTLYRPEKSGVFYFDIVPVLVQGQAKTQLGFGKTNMKAAEFVRIERILSGGSMPHERDIAYKIEDVVQLLNARKLKHESLLEEAKQKENTPNLGFGTTGMGSGLTMSKDNPFSSNMAF